MTLHGHIEQGAIVFDHPHTLPEGALVEIKVIAAGAPQETLSGSEVPSLLERMQDFVGTFEGLPPDASANLDHYLYGVPRRQ